MILASGSGPDYYHRVLGEAETGELANISTERSGGGV
jgi:hypothetical protein